MSREAVRHLSTDLRWAELIRRVGPPRLEIQRQRSLYEALIRAIAHQQLHGRAAEAILGRFAALFPGDAFPAPDAVLATADLALRGCGFSGDGPREARAMSAENQFERDTVRVQC